MQNSLLLLYTTFPSYEVATEISERVLLERLACCVNLFPQGESLYLWNGAIERAQECYALFKTSPELLERLEGFLREHHPYETPAILKGLCSSSENFFDYIMKHT